MFSDRANYRSKWKPNIDFMQIEHLGETFGKMYNFNLRSVQNYFRNKIVSANIWPDLIKAMAALSHKCNQTAKARLGNTPRRRSYRIHFDQTDSDLERPYKWRTVFKISQKTSSTKMASQVCESVEIEFSRTLGTNSQYYYESETGTESNGTILYLEDFLFPDSTRTELSSTEDCLISTIPSLKNPPNSMNVHERTKRPKSLRKWLLILLTIVMILTLISAGIVLIIGHANSLEIIAKKLNSTMIKLSKTQKENEELTDRISKIHHLSSA